jgi:hypothetical protein
VSWERYDGPRHPIYVAELPMTANAEYPDGSDTTAVSLTVYNKPAPARHSMNPIGEPGVCNVILVSYREERKSESTTRASEHVQKPMAARHFLGTPNSPSSSSPLSNYSVHILPMCFKISHLTLQELRFPVARIDESNLKT